MEEMYGMVKRKLIPLAFEHEQDPMYYTRTHQDGMLREQEIREHRLFHHKLEHVCGVAGGGDRCHS